MGGDRAVGCRDAAGDIAERHGPGKNAAAEVGVVRPRLTVRGPRVPCEEACRRKAVAGSRGFRLGTRAGAPNVCT